MAHPGNPVIANGQEKQSVSRDKLSTAFFTVLVAEKIASFDADVAEATHYLVDGSAGGVVVTLEDPALAVNHRFHFVKIDASTNPISIVSNGPTGTGNINGVASASLVSQWDEITVFNDGVDWFGKVV